MTRKRTSGAAQPEREGAWQGEIVTGRQRIEGVEGEALSESVTVMLESAGFACRIFSSTTDYLLDTNPKGGCMIAEIRPKDALARAPGRSAGNADRERAELAEAKARFKALTPRELSVLIEVAKGNSNKIVAHTLGISPRTVEVHRARIMVKLKARSLADLVRLVLIASVDAAWPEPSLTIQNAFRTNSES